MYVPGTFMFPVVIIECDINPRLYRLPGVSELPLHQLLGPHTGPVLLQPRHHRPRGLGLDRVEHPHLSVCSGWYWDCCCCDRNWSRTVDTGLWTLDCGGQQTSWQLSHSTGPWSVPVHCLKQHWSNIAQYWHYWDAYRFSNWTNIWMIPTNINIRKWWENLKVS